MGASVQNELVRLQDHVVAMTRAGVFDKHPAARTVFAYYCLRLAVNDKPGRFEAGCVMPGCTKTKHVTEATGLGKRAVQSANVWLEEEMIIAKVDDTILIRSFDDESEAFRTKKRRASDAHQSASDAHHDELNARRQRRDLG